MYITNTLAKEIEQKASSILNRKVILANASGEVLTDNDYLARGAMVPEALRAIQQGQSFTSTHNAASLNWWPFVYDSTTVGAFGILATEGQLTPEALSLLHSLAEVIVYQSLLMDSLRSADTTRSSFIKTLLTNDQASENEILRQADILKLPIHSPQSVMLMHIESFEEDIFNSSVLGQGYEQKQLLEAIENVYSTFQVLFKNNKQNIISYMGQNVFVIIKGIGGSDLTTQNTIKFIEEKATYIHSSLSKIHRKKITLGVGQYYPELSGLRKSFVDSKLSLNIGVKLHGKGKIYHIRDIGMFTAFGPIDFTRKKEIAEQILYSLMQNKQLFQTVTSFLDNDLSISQTSSTLGIHRNTLIYRLDKAKKLTHLDPRKFEDALQIKLGLVFYNT